MGRVNPELTFWDPHYAEGRGAMSVPLSFPPCRAWGRFSKGSRSELITCLSTDEALDLQCIQEGKCSGMGGQRVESGTSNIGAGTRKLLPLRNFRRSSPG